jgi:hypothetical protein
MMAKDNVSLRWNTIAEEIIQREKVAWKTNRLLQATKAKNQ